MKNPVTTMVKKVNINAPIPVFTLNPPIFGKKEGVSMTPANILKCLIGRATVYEILSDGSKLRLTFDNYNKVNKPAEPKKSYKSNKKPVVDKGPKSAIGKDEVKNSKIIGAKTKILINDEIQINRVYDNTDKLRDESGNEVKVPKVNIEDAKPETIELSDEERELAELEAEIAKLEAEEADK